MAVAFSNFQALDKNSLGPLRKAYCQSLNLLLHREVSFLFGFYSYRSLYIRQEPYFKEQWDYIGFFAKYLGHVCDATEYAGSGAKCISVE